MHLLVSNFILYNHCFFHMTVCLYCTQTHYLPHHCGENVQVRLLLEEGMGCAARLKNRVHKGVGKLDVDVNLYKQLMAWVCKCLGQVELQLP